MAKILQQNIFSWQEVNAKSDLDRLRLVLEYLPDERLMEKLELMRGQGLRRLSCESCVECNNILR